MYALMMNIYKYNHTSFSFSLLFFNFSLVFHLGILVGALVLHLLEFDLPHLEVEAFQELTEEQLVVDDRLSVIFIEIHPNLNTVAKRVGYLRGDESEAIQLIAPLKRLSNELKGKALVNFLLIWLTFRHLEDEPPSLLVLFIFPFGLNPFPEKLDRVNFFQRSIDFVSI
jgi:hypothetical protein